MSTNTTVNPIANITGFMVVASRTRAGLVAEASERVKPAK
jgi:hypothetical protein